VVRHEALFVRMGVGDLHRLAVVAAGLKLAAAEATGRWRRWEQPRRSRDGLVLPDGSGLVSETGRHTRGTGVEASSEVCQLEPGGSGLVGGAHPIVVCGWLGNFREGAMGLAWEATVKVYGVAVTMPQG
jgi:hypothetical protein